MPTCQHELRFWNEMRCLAKPFHTFAEQVGFVDIAYCDYTIRYFRSDYLTKHVRNTVIYHANGTLHVRNICPNLVSAILGVNDQETGVTNEPTAHDSLDASAL